MEELILSPEGKKILINIKFIGFCPENKKISLCQKKYVQPNGWSMENLKRQLSWETRNELLRFIDQTITDATEYLKKENHQDILNLFIHSLEEMMQGIHHLEETYRTEPDVLASLSVYNEELKILTRNLQNKILRLKEKKSKE